MIGLVINYIYALLLLSLAIIGIVRYEILSPSFRILAISAMFFFILYIIERVVIARYKNNIPILHIQAISEYVFYSLAYYHFFSGKKTKIAIVISIALITTLWIIDALFIQPFFTMFPTYINVPSLLLLVIFALMLFRQMLFYPLKTPILKQGVFWYNAAILFYSSTMILDAALSNSFGRNPAFDDVIYRFWYAILYIFTVLLIKGFLTDNTKINNDYAT